MTLNPPTNAWTYTDEFQGDTLGLQCGPMAQAHLIDGSLVMAVVNSGATTIEVFVSSVDRTGTSQSPASVTIPTALYATTTGVGTSQIDGETQCIDLAVDSSDNLYLCWASSANDALSVVGLTKGLGHTWAASAISTPRLGVAGSAPAAGVRMIWSAAAGGGTGGHGFLLVVWCGAVSNPVNGYDTYDAGLALAGTLTTATNGAASPAFLSTTTKGTCLDLSPDGLGATSGLALCGGAGATVTTLNIGKWAINSSGALTTNANVSTITGTGLGYIIQTTYNQYNTAQLLRISAGLWVALYPTSSGTLGTAVCTTSAVTATGVAPTTPPGLSGVSWAVGPAGQCFVDPTTANTIWVVFLNQLVSGSIGRLRAVVAAGGPTVTWDSTFSTFDVPGGIINSYASAGITAAYASLTAPTARVPAQPVSSVVDAMVLYGSTAATTALLGGANALYAPEPITPVLLTPKNGTIEDLAAGQTFTWTPDPSATQPWYSFERQPTGSGNEWWNGTTFQTTECWINATVASLVFGSGLWADFSTMYEWWVRTMNQYLVPSALPSPFAVTGALSPSVAVSASSITTSTPTISWTITPGTFSTVQASYRVIIGVSGFTPVTGASLYDTGVVTSRTVGSVKSGALLANGNYDAYVIVVMSDGSTNGTANKASFTITISGAPTTPTLTATVDASNDRVLLTVTGTGSNTAYVEFSDDGGTTWAQVRNTNDSPADYAYLQLSGGVGTVYDYELVPGTQRTYQAAQVSNNGVFSAYSATVTATLSPTDWWWKNPLFPTENMIVVVQPPFKTKVMETLGEYRPLVEPGVSSFPVFSSGGVQGVDGTIQVLTITKAAFAALVTLYRYAGTTLLQSPFGYQWYIRVNAPRQPIQDPGTSTNPRRVTTIAYAEVAKPVIVPILPTAVPIQTQRAVARIRTAVTKTQTAHASIVG